MEIAEVRAFPIETAPRQRTKPRVPEIPDAPPIVSPMRRYPGLLPRSRGDWRDVACVVTARDGTWGFGLGCFSPPVAGIIEDHLGPMIAGENCMATEKLFDAMQRATAHYGTSGLASYAISAVDMALWDLKGKLLQRPVYELLGGPQKTAIPCYASATGHNYGIENSIEWFLELGFNAVKVFFRHGPDDDMEGLRRNEELVATARELIGDERELMVDAWMSFDVEYVVRLSEALKPYRIKWFEDYVRPEDLGSYVKLRERIPHQILATGEHWYSIPPFAFAAANGLVDIFQPDVRWVGGISAAPAHLPPRRSPRPARARPRRHELPVRPAPLLRDACRRLGRTLGGGLPAGSAAGGDGAAARNLRRRERLRRPQRRPGVRARDQQGVARGASLLRRKIRRPAKGR